MGVALADGVGVDEAVKAQDLTEQILQHVLVEGVAVAIQADVVGLAVIGDGLGGDALVDDGLGVAGHHASGAGLKGSDEGLELIVSQRVLGGVDAVATGIAVALKAVVGGAVAGEVLHGDEDAALHHALVAVLIADDQIGGDLRGHLHPLTVGGGVAGPAGVGHQVDLRTVEGLHTLGPHDHAVILSIGEHGVGIAVTQGGSGHTFGVGQAVADGVGKGQIGHGHLAVQDGLILAELLKAVVEPHGHLGLGVAAQNKVAHTGGHQVLDVGGVGILVPTAAEAALCGIDQGPDGLAVLIHHIRGLGALGAVRHNVEKLIGELVIRHSRSHCLGTGLSIQAPVFKVVQLLVVVQVAEVKAVLNDDAQQGHTDGGAVRILIEHGLQELRGQLVLTAHSVGSGYVAVLQSGLSTGGGGGVSGFLGCAGGQQADEHGCRKQQGDDSFHDCAPSSSISSCKLVIYYIGGHLFFTIIPA